MSDNDVTRAPLPRGGGEFGWAQMDGPSLHSADPFEVQVRETESGQFQVTIRPKGLVSGGIQLALPLSWWVVVFASVCKAAGVEPATPVFTPADAVELAARAQGQGVKA